ncbi:MAG: molybdopterin molybdenumtransferase MoeA, partial [Planctomycetia bacterium]
MNEQNERSRPDVRMRGFATRHTVEQATEWIEQQVASLHPASERVELRRAAGRVLTADVVSSVAVPGFYRSMMDGYAIQAADAQGANSWNPIRLTIIGASFPGKAFLGEIRSGEAVRIMTGAPMPAGADCVLPVEMTQLDGGHVEALEDVALGKHVGRPGEDISEGQLVLRAGRR